MNTSASTDFGGQPSLLLRQAARLGVIDPNIAEEAGAPHIVQRRECSPRIPSPSDSIQLQQPLYTGTGMFYQARNFTVQGTFVDGSVTYNNASTNNFMEKLLDKTILGAEFDSSDRDPPPRCHPGTRLAVLKRCLSFVNNCNGKKRIRWVVGGAGVGKSAIMQSVAESPELPVSYHVSVFFSINGRRDGTKAVITICYQFAAKSDSYRQVIEREISRDPSLLRSSMSKQFNKLVIEPFIFNPYIKSAGRVLVIIDGLDECDNPSTQQELLRLITDFCITYPSSPFVWLIASRPEPHITSFFSRGYVIQTYEKEEIPVNSNEARAEVERFLRDKLTEIKEATDSLDARWPQECDIWRLASAADGLFAYANTVIRYIGDSRVGSPASQLSDVLHVIDNHSMTGVLLEEHPLALLDTLYDRILSNVPSKIMANTRKLLLALTSRWDFALKGHHGSFLLLCNWLGMTPDEAYAALNHLRSVLYVPRRNQAYNEALEPFHKSFLDYLSDFTRSKFTCDDQGEAQQLMTQCAFRILEEAPDGINLSHLNDCFRYGSLMRGPGSGKKILLIWSVEDADCWNDSATRLMLYKLAIGEVVAGIKRGDPSFKSKFCVRLLTARFHTYDYPVFPYDELRDLVFDASRRLEFMKCGILENMPLDAVRISNLVECTETRLQFYYPATRAIYSPDHWNPSCGHERAGEYSELKWMTNFHLQQCDFCFQRLARQIKKIKVQCPEHTVTVLFTSSVQHCVEFRWIDPEDGMSEWTYWFWIQLSYKERQRYI